MSEKELEQLKKELKEILEQGNKKIYVNIKKTSRSNLTWYFRVFTIINNELNDISWYLEQLGLYKMKHLTMEGYCLVGGGVGTNRAFEVAYNLGLELYNNGYELTGSFI